MSTTEQDSLDGAWVQVGPHRLTLDTEITIRNESKREIDVRLAPFDVAIETIQGPEVISRGSFEGIVPENVLLMGLEHEVHLGVGQDGSIVPTRHPTGRAISVEERDDGAYATFRVAKTASGDEILALAAERVVRGVSIEMGKNARIRTAMRNGRRTQFVEWTDMRAAAPTYQPAYSEAELLAVRSKQEEARVATDEQATTEAAEITATVEEKPRVEVQARSTDERVLLAEFASVFNQPMEKVLDRLEKIEERSRMGFEIPSTPAEKPKVSSGAWMEIALKILSGERIPDSAYRVTQDLVTADNAGIVPDAFINDLIGVIDPQRPFMASTRRLDTPDAGMTLVVPKITQRPSVAEQSAEKALLSSTKTIITSESFEVMTFGGVGDLSLQLLKRASRSFLTLYLELLAEAYAIETDEAAVAALISAVADGGPEPAGPLDPELLNLGAAYVAAFDAIRRPPDTIWLSTEAIGEFIDAKASTTNAPLYPGLTPSATAGGGISGTISGLRAVHVPALDAKGAYAIVGPSRGFAWAEDGTYTLQVDVPSKAGRDVALVGMVWFAPYYPAAFTLFNVAS